MNVLGIGEIVLDKVNLLNYYPAEGEKIQPLKVENSLGGPVPIALVLLSRLGVNCTLMATVDGDDAADKLKTRLRKEKIHFIQRTAKSTKMNTILVNSQNGSRTIIRDSVQHPPIINLDEKVIKQADVIMFDRHEPQAFEEVVAKKRPETKIIIDPSTEVSGKTISMIENADYPIIPYESLTKFRTHEDFMSNLKAVYEIAKKPVVITLGEDGSLIYDGKKVEHVPAAKVDVIDTLGAGDIYRGAFAYGVLKGWSIKKCAEYGNLVAALQCARLGNHEAIPTKQEIEQFKKIVTYKSDKKNNFSLNFAL